MNHEHMYRVDFYRDDSLIKSSIHRFYSWDHVATYIVDVLKFEYIELDDLGFYKNGVVAEIMCKNGIPF